MTAPSSTYRLQFRDGMTFDHAAAIVPYLKRLGISHFYASPIFTAVRGSAHGYDVVDHNELDPTLGGREGFERLSTALRQAGLGLIVDIVPNHMAASVENPWWRSVLQWGRQSPFAAHFDIDWQERLTLPILGRSFDEALAAGEITLAADEENGTLALTYFETLLPLHPASWALALSGSDDQDAHAIAARAGEAAPHSAETLRADLAGLLASKGDKLRQALDDAGRDRDLVQRVHDAQPWRLQFWQEASKHLSYRRFFEVTGLVGVRVEDDAVFDDVHRLILDLVRSGTVDGLRIDHVDGLADPGLYLDKLRAAAGAETYIVIEKILGEGETLPPEWPVAGTTGYEFIDATADVLLDASKAAALDEAWTEICGRSTDYAEAERAAKILIVYDRLETELTRLVGLGRTVASAAATGGSFGDDELRRAIGEIAIAFPVYRTYFSGGRPTRQDRHILDKVEKRLQRPDGQAGSDATGFVLGLLRGASAGTAEAEEFRTRFQQMTGPVMAKAVEDTLFYRFNRLIALNEVGGEPAQAGRSVSRFHAKMQERVSEQPYGLLASSTHDTKRGEDARARLFAISEAPQLWAEAVAGWRSMNGSAVRRFDAGPAPEPEVEWLLYQSLAGIWPGDSPMADPGLLEGLRERFVPYVEKALREAKQRTDWVKQDAAYEGAVKAYAKRLLAPDNIDFLADFDQRLQPFIEAGRVNSLTQTLLKMTAPGIPDIYQGSEDEDLSLADPDNRRPVDFDALAKALEGQAADHRSSEKTRMIATCLRLRRERPRLFTEGAYVSLAVHGAKRDHLVAYMRQSGDEIAIAIAARLPFALMAGGASFADDGFWGDTEIEWPPQCQERLWREALSEADRDPAAPLAVSSILGSGPAALLTSLISQPPER